MRLRLLVLSALSFSPAGCRHAVPADSSLTGRWAGALRLGDAEQRLTLDVRRRGGEHAVLILVPELLRVDSTAEIRHDGRLIELALRDGPERLLFTGPRRGDTLDLRSAETGMSLRVVRRGAVPPPVVRLEARRLRTSTGAVAATLVLPTAPGRHPGVVLVHGSGRSTREPLLPLARHFAERGIAALVYDKREPVGFGGDELTPLDDLADDAAAALALLAAEPAVDPTRVGLWGGSQGSAVVARVAGTTPGVAFIVSVAGGGTAYTPFVVYQTRSRLGAAGHPPASLDLAEDAVRARHGYIRGQISTAELEARLARARPVLANTIVPLTVPSAAEVAAWRRGGHLEGDGSTRWAQVRVPALAIWGGRDDRVPSAESARNVAAALGAMRHPATWLCIVPDADHGMRLPAGPGAGASGGHAFPRLAPAYLDGMLAWVRERTGLAPAGAAAAALRAGGCENVPGGRTGAGARAPAGRLEELRWLEGRWRGSAAGGPPFFEAHAIRDDSTLVVRHATDETFTRWTDSSVVRLRGDSLVSEGAGARWIATEFSRDAAVFRAGPGALNGFTWRRESADAWLAVIEPLDPRRPRVTYRMERVRE